MQFLEKLGSMFGLDEVSRELGFDLQTDALLARAEQLTKLEGDRLADKVRVGKYFFYSNLSPKKFENNMENTYLCKIRRYFVFFRRQQFINFRDGCEHSRSN